MNEKVTIFIPTYNRPEYLARTLYFLKAQITRIPIIVADGSRPDEAARNRQACEEHGDEVDYFHVPSPLDSAGVLQNYRERYLRAVDQVRTPYVATCADDDLLVVGSAVRCAEFLDKHPEFVACHGVYLGFRYLSRGIVVDNLHYNGPSFDGGEAGARLIQLHALYEAPFYAVFRTATQRVILREALQLTPAMFAEIHHSTLAVLTGKIKRLDEIYYLRNLGVPPHAREVEGWIQWMAKDFDQLFDYYRNHRKRVINYALSLPDASLDAATYSTAMDMAFLLYVGRQFSLGYWIDQYLARALIDETERQKTGKWLEKYLMTGQGHGDAVKIKTAGKRLIRHFLGEKGIELARKLRALVVRTRAEIALSISLIGQSNVSIARPIETHFPKAQWDALLPILRSLAEFHEHQHGSGPT